VKELISAFASLVTLFCYRECVLSSVYISEIHFRANQWDFKRWAWEGILKVTSKGEECIIKLEDKSTGKTILNLLQIDCTIFSLFF